MKSLCTLTATLFVFLASQSQATLIQNPNFSTGDFTGWQTTGNMQVTNYANLSCQYSSLWDTSVIGATMDGNFALYDSGFRTQEPGVSTMGTVIKNVSNDNPFIISFDYAVAWSNPSVHEPYGYFWVEVFGIDKDGVKHTIGGREPEWGYANGSEIYGVQNYSVYSGNATLPGFAFDEIFLLFNFARVNVEGMQEIVAVDNIRVTAPVPEPATMVLLGFGVAGLAAFRKKFKTN